MTNKIKVLIIDDEDDAREFLKELLVDLFSNEIEIIGYAHNVQSGLEEIRIKKPEVVFLDIQMPDGTGFDMLKRIPKVNFEVVFVTAYDNYAIEAFKISAFSYLLKPLEIKELSGVVEKLIQNKATFHLNKAMQFKVLTENYDSNKNKKLILPNREGFEIVEINTIIRCEADSNYTKFIIQEGKSILISKTIKRYEELLGSYGFHRIHQSFLVNMQFVRHYIKSDGGFVEMVDGVRVPISRNRREEFIELFNSYHGFLN